MSEITARWTVGLFDVKCVGNECLNNFANVKYLRGVNLKIISSLLRAGGK